MSSYREIDRPTTWGQAALITGVFVALLYVIELVDVARNGALDQYGVSPRTDEGLVGIAFAPFLHGGWGHLVANTGPTLVLGFLVLVSGIARGIQVTAVIWIVGGVGVWLIGQSGTTHIGASGLIFGWLVYLIIRGFWTRSAGEIILGMVLFFIYGGVLFGVLPGQPGVSWEGHLFGAVGGGLAAWLLSERRRRGAVI